MTAALLGPAAWWLARRYLEQAYPHHPEMLGAAVVTGLLDGVLLACIAFGICFAIRIWIFESRERKESDAALRRELQDIEQERNRETGGEPPISRH